MDDIIEAKHLVKKYGDFTAVNDVSFQVKKGEIFAFLGPNGAGKTTTIKMLTTLLKPTSGEIDMSGFNVANQQDRVRKSFGIVFQDPSLDDELTAYENMYFHAVLYKVPVKERADRIENLLKFVDLVEKKKVLVKNFSGGMKRRLEIARGFLHRPAVIFLDEPTLGLDPQTRNSMWNYIQDLNKSEQLTIFFTTHYMEEADRNAHRVAVIDHGKIIATGSPAQLKDQTKTQTLEDAFLALTGKAIREEEGSSKDRMKTTYNLRHGGGRR